MTMGGLRDAIFSDKAIWEVTRSGHGLKMLKRTVRIDRLNLGWFSQQNRWCLGSFTRENMDLTWIYCNYHSTPIISWNGSTLYTSPHWMKFRQKWRFSLVSGCANFISSFFHSHKGMVERCRKSFSPTHIRAGVSLSLLIWDSILQKSGMETASVPKKRRRENVHKRQKGPEKDSATRLHISHHLQMFSNKKKKNQFFLVDLILAMALAKSGYVGLYRNYHPCGGTVCARPACFGTLIQRLLVSVRLGSLGCPKFFKEDVPSGKLT